MMRVFDTTHEGQAAKVLTFDAADMAVTEDRILTGYAMIWNVLSEADMFGTRVKLLPGSATFRTPTLALYSHDFAEVIGNTANQTLSIQPDDKGARVEIRLPDTTTGRDVYQLVKDGYVGGMSFMMTKWKSTIKNDNGAITEIVNQFEVPEVTVTPMPRFKQTTIEVKREKPKEYAAIAMQGKAKLQRIALHSYRPI